MSVNLYDPNTGQLTQVAGSGGGGATIQLTQMPTASSTYAGKVYQYIGASDANFTNGLFYKCVENSGSYSWVYSPAVKAPKSSAVSTASLADDDVYSAKMLNSQLGIGTALNTTAQNHAAAINELNSQLVNQYVEFGSYTPTNATNDIYSAIENNNVDIYDYKNIAIVGIQNNPNGYNVDVPGDFVGVLPVALYKFYVDHAKDRDGYYFPNSAYWRIYFPSHNSVGCAIIDTSTSSKHCSNHYISNARITSTNTEQKFRKMLVLLFN